MDAQVESAVAAPQSAQRSGRGKHQAFELKGMVAPLTVLRLRTTDTGVIAKQLIPKVTQMPQLFQDAPVLVDLAGLGDDARRLHFSELAALLRSCKMVPVAITGGKPEARAKAASAGFGYVTPPAQRGGGRAIEIPSEETPAPEPLATAPSAAKSNRGSTSGVVTVSASRGSKNDSKI